jgi:hypothetical protein
VSVISTSPNTVSRIAMTTCYVFDDIEDANDARQQST